MADGTQQGGASTISGVLYQVLWSLLRALKIHVKSPAEARQGEALLVLEPAGGGGDLRVTSDVTEVEQLKAKSDGGTWSLQTIICDVLPDMFLAVDDRGGARRFRFITEGRMGRWADVYRFFWRLGSSEPPADILGALDGERPLNFQTAKRSGGEETPFFAESTYTERSLFLLIASTLRSIAAIKKLGLTDAEFHSRLWRLLGAFEFVGEQVRENVQHEIDLLLLAVVDRKEQLPQVRDFLALDLLRKSAAGNAEITAESFLSEHGLNAAPLTNWSLIRTRSHAELKRLLAARRYEPEQDVRYGRGASLAQSWRDSSRVLVIAGESGQGKTWALAAIARHAASDDAPVIWVDATGDPAHDLDLAARQFWLDIRGGETPLPLRQITGRLNSIVPATGKHRLRICLDNVADYDEAAAIVREEWPALGVSVAMSCPLEVATSLAQEFPDSVQVISCKDFTWEELHELLERKLGLAWSSIPQDVRATLKRPLLASIYCDELFDENWQATNEYELFGAVWKRLTTGHQTSSPLDSVAIESLADAVLRGEPYPWTFQQLAEHGVENDALKRLERCGWLARTADGRVEIFHDRLLNWAVAQSLFNALRSNKRTVQDVTTQVAEVNKADGRAGKVFLGYVAMDLMWLIASDPALAKQAGPKLLEAIESSYGHRPEVLYRELAPTIGPRVIDALFQRYRDYEGYPWVLRAIAKALAATAGERVADFAKLLLAESDPRLKRRALFLLKWASCPKLLDKIWQLHVNGLANPKPFLDEHEQDWVLRNDSWEALRRSAMDAPDWIVAKIQQADPASEPVHDLGWLIANLPDGTEAWHKAKTDLFEKVSAPRRRLLARCIGLFRDNEHVAWLRDNLAEEEHFVVPEAMQALSRLAPDEAAAALDHVKLDDVQLSSASTFSEIWHRRKSACDERLLARAKELV